MTDISCGVVYEATLASLVLFRSYCYVVFFEFSNSTCFASRDFEKLQHVQVVSDKRLRDQQSQKFRPCNSANTKTLEFGADLKKIEKSSFSKFCLASQEDFKVTKAKGGDPKLGTIARGPPRHHGAGVYRRMGPYAGKFKDLLWDVRKICTYKF